MTPAVEREAMTDLTPVIQDLVIANRILGREKVVDAYGHVSVRHPDNPNRFLIARSLAPELVGPEDIVELTRRSAGARRSARPLSRALHSCGDLRGAVGRHGGRPRPCRGHAALRHCPGDKAARHQGQYRLEVEPRGGMAAVRGDLPSPREEP